jgi:hypothetical protein
MALAAILRVLMVGKSEEVARRMRSDILVCGGGCSNGNKERKKEEPILIRGS